MHPYLTKLGIQAEEQAFFHEASTVDEVGNLVFSYGDRIETYGLAFHRVPVTEKIWTAGNHDHHMVRQVFICYSAIDAIAFLSFNRKKLVDLDHLFFVATGLRPCRAQVDWVATNFPNRNIGLLFSNDLPGRITDLRVAAGINGLSLAVTVADGLVNIRFRYRDYPFTTETFSLNQFEKQSGQRFRCRTFKPRQADSWANELFQKLAKK